VILEVPFLEEAWHEMCFETAREVRKVSSLTGRVADWRFILMLGPCLQKQRFMRFAINAMLDRPIVIVILGALHPRVAPRAGEDAACVLLWWWWFCFD